MQGFDRIIDALLLYFIVFVFFKKILTYKVHKKKTVKVTTANAIIAAFAS